MRLNATLVADAIEPRPIDQYAATDNCASTHIAWRIFLSVEKEWHSDMARRFDEILLSSVFAFSLRASSVSFIPSLLEYHEPQMLDVGFPSCYYANCMQDTSMARFSFPTRREDLIGVLVPCIFHLCCAWTDGRTVHSEWLGDEAWNYDAMKGMLYVCMGGLVDESANTCMLGLHTCAAGRAIRRDDRDARETRNE